MDWRPFAAGEPFFEISRGQDYRLAIVDRLHDSVRFTREGRKCLFPFLCVRISPLSPDPGYPKEFTPKHGDFIFAFRSVFRVLPLKESGRRDNAAVRGELFFPEVCFRNPFRPRIEEKPVR